jgi:sarcosine oxidase subunit beta
MFPQRADVVVIGAGVIGSSIAYQLSKRKIKVVLLEKGELVAGSSGACGGAIFLQSKSPGVHLKLALESARGFYHLEEELGSDIEYKNNGGMIIVENNEERETLKQMVENQRKMGLAVSLLDQKQARELEPCLKTDILASTFSPLDAQVNPIALTFALINAARRLGTKLYADTKAVGIGQNSQRINTVKTNKGEIETEIVVNAAGVHAPEIGEMLGLRIPIKPRRGQLLVTETVAPIISRCLLSAQYICAKFDPDLAETGGGGISIEQLSKGNLLIGSTREFVGFDKNTTYEGIKYITRHVARIIPKIKDIHIIRAFAGLRPYTPDGLPILGRTDAVDGFIMAAGHEGDGITLSPITGQIIADLIVDKKTDISLNAFKLERFNT